MAESPISLKELIYVELTHRDHALQLQAREYERRLDELNHAHERAQETQSKTVSRESFDSYKEHHAEEVKSAMHEISEWRNSINTELATQKTYSVVQANQSARLWAFAAAAATLVLNILIRYLTSRMGGP